MPETKPDVFQAMVAGKISDIKRAVDEIEAEIGERTGIDAAVLAEIQNEILEVRNRMLEVEQFSGSMDSSRPFPKVDTLEKELVDLEGQRRFEKVSYWRDLTNLRKELRLYMKELNDLMRKAELVKNDSSGRFAKEA